jgi:transcription initiation factor TFIIIB Brf1 subunit/transcription initiation factor TFIIB
VGPDREAAFLEIRSIADSLGLREEIAEGAADLVATYLEYGPEDPPRVPVMAASAVYMSSIMWGKPVSQRILSESIGASRGTLNRGYRKMAGILFPNVGECCTRAGLDGEREPELPSG